MMEMLIAIVLIGILVAIAAPKFYSIAMRYRVDEALNTVAADLRQAVSLAAREQKPVTIALETTTRYVVKDRATSPADTVRLRRDMQLGSDAGVRSISFSPATVTVYANGIISSALTVTLTSDSYARQVTLSVAGQVRVVAAP
jgi:Tfp pilus assembly protein FimT